MRLKGKVRVKARASTRARARVRDLQPAVSSLYTHMCLQPALLEAAIVDACEAGFVSIKV